MRFLGSGAFLNRLKRCRYWHYYWEVLRVLKQGDDYVETWKCINKKFNPVPETNDAEEKEKGEAKLRKTNDAKEK